MQLQGYLCRHVTASVRPASRKGYTSVVVIVLKHGVKLAAE